MKVKPFRLEEEDEKIIQKVQEEQVVMVFII